ncbi:GIY-YIG nuclease family protein, partial [Streptococcus suis]
MEKSMTKSDKAVAYMYVLECSDGTLYTGYTTDLERRI